MKTPLKKAIFSRKVRALSLLLYAILLAGCQAPREGDKAFIRPDEGHLRLYLEMDPGGAAQFRFNLAEIAVISEDGTIHPLRKEIAEIKAPRMSEGQFLLARGDVPAGDYVGFSIQVQEAFLLGELGEGNLMVSKEPTVIDLKFHLDARSAEAFYLDLEPVTSVEDGYRFSPVFHISRGVEELVALKGYVSETPDRLVSVFDKVSMRSSGVIGTGAGPMGIVLDRDRGRAYVALAGDDAVEVLDLHQRRSLWRVPLRFGDRPCELALTPDRRTLVVTNQGSGSISLIDAWGLMEKKRIRVGEGPSFVVLDQRGERAFILNRISNTVSVVDLPGASLIGTITLENTPWQAVLDPTGEKLIVSGGPPALTIIDVPTMQVTDSLRLDAAGLALYGDHRSGLLFLGLAGMSKIVVIDSFAPAETNAIPTAGPVTYLALDSEENVLLALVSEQGVVEKIDVIDLRLLERMRVTPGTYGLAVGHGR